MVGNIIIRVVIGMPSMIGVMKEANRFSFMCGFKGFVVFVVWCSLVRGRESKSVLRFLVEVVRTG